MYASKVVHNFPQFFVSKYQKPLIVGTHEITIFVAS